MIEEVLPGIELSDKGLADHWVSSGVAYRTLEFRVLGAFMYLGNQNGLSPELELPAATESL